MELSAKPLQLMGTPPSPREAHSMLLLDSYRILVFGGGCVSPAFGPQQFNDLFLLDLQESKWSYIHTSGEMPCARSGHTAVLLDDGQVLVFGGSSMDLGHLNDVYLLNTTQWRWSALHPKGVPPSPRDKHTACLCGSKLYVFGGFGPSMVIENGHEDGRAEAVEGQISDSMSEDSDHENDSSEEEDEDGRSMSFTWFNNVHVLDLQSMKWEDVSTSGTKPTARAAHAAFIYQRQAMVVFGGRDASGRQNDLYMLDLKALEWKKEASQKVPSPRSFHVMLSLGNTNLAVSYGGMGVEGELFRGVEVLDVQTNLWMSVNACGSWPPLRGAAAMVSCVPSQGGEASKLIIFGGSCSLEGKDPIYYNDTYAIDISSLFVEG